MPLSQVVIPYNESLDFGIGLCSTNASAMGKVVQGEISGVSHALGASARFEISRILSTHELEEKLNIDAKASYSAGPFANISGRGSFARSCKICSTSLHFCISSAVVLGQEFIDDPQLTAPAAALVDNSEMFHTRFGDMFVRGMTRGGLFLANMQLDTRGEDESKDITSSLSGAYDLFSGDAKEKFSKVVKDTHSGLTIRVYHEGGPVGLIMNALDDPLQFLAMFEKWMKSFVDEPDKMAVPFAAVLAPIEIANGPLPPNAADAEHARDVLVHCAKERSSCIDGLNLMDAIIQAPTRYAFVAPVSIAQIRAAAHGYQEDLDIIAAAASAAMDHPATAKMPAAFAEERKQAYPQGIPPDPMPSVNMGQLGVLAARGRQVALGDPLLTALRDIEPEGPARTGFHIGLAVAGNDSLPGPEKEKFKQDHINDFDPGAYQRAVNYTVDRNANAERAARGAQVVAAKPEVTEARAKLPVEQWLGFNICAAIFGGRDDRGEGNTLRGPRSGGIRQQLSPAAKQGYDAALAFYKIP